MYHGPHTRFPASGKPPLEHSDGHRGHIFYWFPLLMCRFFAVVPYKSFIAAQSSLLESIGVLSVF